MAYEKQTFLDEIKDENGNVTQEGTVLKAENLNHIEDGIVEAEKKAEQGLSVGNSAVNMAMFTAPGALLWNGDTTGREVLSIGDINLVHVSNEVPEINSEYAFVQIGMYGFPYDGGEEDVVEISDSLVVVGDCVIISKTDNVDFNGLTLNAGVYFYSTQTGGGMFVSGLLIPGYNFQGDVLVGEKKSNTLVWDGNTEGLSEVSNSGTVAKLFKVSDNIPSNTELENGGFSFVLSGSVYSGSISDASNSPVYEEGYAIPVNSDIVAAYVIRTGGIRIEPFYFEETGIYFSKSDSCRMLSLSVSNNIFSEIIKLEEKYLPDSVVKDGDTEFILASSTAGSTKKFKVTVDDTGTLTTTEVT